MLTLPSSQLCGSYLAAYLTALTTGFQTVGNADSLWYCPVVMPEAADDPHKFDFDLDRGIRAQVVEKLEASPLLPLTRVAGPAFSGIYALYFKGVLVYIGKASKGTTKSKRTLRSRLSEHAGKIDARQNITLAVMQCRYLTFSSEWWVFAAEFALITHYKPEWNASGFGSKIPGVGRPGTHRISSWNKLFPPKKP